MGNTNTRINNTYYAIYFYILLLNIHSTIKEIKMKHTYFEKCNQIIDEIIRLRNKLSIKELSDSEKAKINEILETIIKV